MRNAAVELMQALASGIAADEASVKALLVMAEHAESSGRTEFAATFRSQARLHRVKAMELDARLGAMVEQYGPLHLEQQ